jgi:succinyl-CoA synthetase beta subunit
LLQQYGVAVPEGVLARTAPEAAAAAARWGGHAVIKAQVLTGGRGKAGAIRVVSSADDARAAAGEILAMSVKGLPVQQVLVTQKLDIRAEYYAGVTVDRETRAIVLILSAAGGMDIEDIAAKEPQKIRRFRFGPAIAKAGARSMGVSPMISEHGQDAGGPHGQDAHATKWLAASFAEEALRDQAVTIVDGMHRLFREKDCSLVEINPLAVTAQGRLVAADAKIVLDDNGLFRHPDLAALRNAEEYTQDEWEAKEAGLSYVSLAGEIGCMVNGAGLAMATMDGIKLAGGSPANFLDVGGSSNPQKVLDAMRILLRNRDLKAILINIFGGITRCDDIAEGILLAKEKLKIGVPMVIRLIGTNEEQGRARLEGAGLIAARRMTDAIENVVRCAQGESPS